MGLMDVRELVDDIKSLGFTEEEIGIWIKFGESGGPAELGAFPRMMLFTRKVDFEC